MMQKNRKGHSTVYTIFQYQRYVRSTPQVLQSSTSLSGFESLIFFLVTCLILLTAVALGEKAVSHPSALHPHPGDLIRHAVLFYRWQSRPFWLNLLVYRILLRVKKYGNKMSSVDSRTSMAYRCSRGCGEIRLAVHGRSFRDRMSGSTAILRLIHW